jgi:hypothetical protein
MNSLSFEQRAMRPILFLLCISSIIACQPTTESKRSDKRQETLAQTIGSLKLWLNLLPAPYFYSSVQIDNIGLIDSNENIHSILGSDNGPLVISSLLSQPTIVQAQFSDIPVGHYESILVTINLENTQVNWIDNKALIIPFLYDTFGKSDEEAQNQITVEIPISGQNSLNIHEEKTANLAITHLAYR